MLPPQTRIDGSIGDIDQEGDEDDGEDQKHDHRFDDDQVALGNALENQPSEAGQEEDVLDDDGARQQKGELQAENGQDGDEGVAYRVPPQRLRAGQPLGAGGADIILAERIRAARTA